MINASNVLEKMQKKPSRVMSNPNEVELLKDVDGVGHGHPAAARNGAFSKFLFPCCSGHYGD